MTDINKTKDSNEQRKYITLKRGILRVFYKDNSLIGEYILKKINPSLLFDLRLSKNPYFLLKSNGKYAITPIPQGLSLINTCKSPHLCSTCEHCYALPEKHKVCNQNGSERSGCAKICDMSPEEYTDMPFETRIQESHRLEKYDFITLGFETFNCQPTNTFTVLKCANYEKDSRLDIEFKPQDSNKKTYNMPLLDSREITSSASSVVEKNDDTQLDSNPIFLPNYISVKKKTNTTYADFLRFKKNTHNPNLSWKDYQRRFSK